MFREFVVLRERRRHEFEMATLQAYQTVRIWVMTKSKKRLPKFESLLERDGGGNTLSVNTPPAKARAMLQMIAAAAGTKVRTVPAKGGA